MWFWFTKNRKFREIVEKSIHLNQHLRNLGVLIQKSFSESGFFFGVFDSYAVLHGYL